ncbi:MAG: hypothetical protein M5T61_11805 [Acidimicrobiia bacterium]|nr:hypothetical protein [Acidimicrobiia bacterium]
MRSTAYLDSGAVNLITSAIVAGFAGIIVVFKMGIGRIIGIFSPRRRAALRAAQESRRTPDNDG